MRASGAGRGVGSEVGYFAVILDFVNVVRRAVLDEERVCAAGGVGAANVKAGRCCRVLADCSISVQMSLCCTCIANYCAIAANAFSLIAYYNLVRRRCA